MRFSILRPFLFLFSFSALVWLFLPLVSADPVQSLPLPPSSHPPSALETLKDLQHSIQALENSILEMETAYVKTPIEERRQAIRAELRRQLSLRDAYQREFESIATGMEIEGTDGGPIRAFRLEEEIMEVLRPLIEGLKQMTSRPRELERLRKDLAFYENTLPGIRQAIARVSAFKEAAKDPLLKQHLSETLLSWHEKEKETLRQIRRLSFQLDQKTDPKEPMLTSLQKGFMTFIKTRGRNLFLAFSAFVGTFLCLRLLYWRWTQNQKKSPPPLHHRLLQLVFHSTTALASISAALLLLYAFGDWMLLSIALLLLIALVWSARNGMSQFWEQGKLILNMGTLREGERVIYQGLPWKVERLALYGVLVNPELEGGILRMPLKHLIGMQSRPFMPEEPWFPSRKHDILLLEGDQIARVILQTPEQVVAELEGGAQQTWPAGVFLGLSLCNLSRTGFGIRIVLHLHRRLQQDITKNIPRTLKAFMEKKLASHTAGKTLLDLEVSFMETAPSSLDLRIFAAFPPDAAAQYLWLQRHLRKVALEACTHLGWEIPLPQLTLHSG